ncbi:MAG: hypothetical protein BIP78_0588 [Candidatus Bipolaricaulis sibiricus]|uniref:Uncharacterized protein n=1 Tax=Bipolaricaulis sibiricus TaxID=2501609 RepID=A0A410FTM7_BIPS1|nr:MAG: hypothetical protein BIP78_0588 [Candidatus Bipolaricaulis sibiricus]
MPERVENLEIWQRGVRGVTAADEVTRDWPSEARHGLTTQLRRAAVSVPTPIAEGVGRGRRCGAVRSAPVPLGSLSELSTLWVAAEGLGYLTEDPAAGLRREIEALTRPLPACTGYQPSRSDRATGCSHNGSGRLPQAPGDKPRTGRRTDDDSHP